MHRIKLFLKNILLKAGLWYRIQYTQWYREYKSPGYKAKIETLTEFYNKLFKNKKLSLIFDIGANAGDYSYVLAGLCNKLVCIEPDDKNNDILVARFGNNKNIVIVKKAIAEEDGLSVFHIEAEGSALNTLSNKWINVLSEADKTRFEKTHKFTKTREVETMGMGSLIQTFGIPDYIKIDVEGFEKEVVSGLQLKIPIISFECNLPEFSEETTWIIDHLFRLNPNVGFNYIRNDGFELEKNVSATEISDLVTSGRYRFLEIYCFN